MPTISVIAFGSEGPPYDDGLPVSLCLPTFKAKCIEKGKVDNVYCYTPRTLPMDIDENVRKKAVKRYDESHKLLNTYHTVGLGAWRAVLLNYHVKNAENGEVICFHDPNYKKYNQINVFAENARNIIINICKHIGDDEIFSPPHGYSLPENTSITSLDHLKLFLKERYPDEPLKLNPNLNARHMVRARMVVIKVSEKTRKFCGIYEAACLEESILSPPKLPNGGWPVRQYKHIHHAAEQAVLNMLISTLTDYVKNNWINTDINLTESTYRYLARSP